MFTSSEINRLIRGIVFTLLLAILIIGFIYLRTEAVSFEAIFAVLTLIFSLFFVPPFLGYVEKAFRISNDVRSIMREQLKTIWINDYLRAEEQTLNGSGIAANLTNLALIIDELDCELNTTYRGYNHEMLDLPMSEIDLMRIKLDNIFDYSDGNSNSNHDGKLFITSDDTLSTIFYKFKRIVQTDQSYTGEFIVLLGERGVRKSVQLLKLAEYLIDQDQRIPLYLNLFSWAAGCKPLQIWLANEVQRQYDMLDNQAKNLINHNYLVLLLDGFEEIPFDRRAHFVRCLTRFLQARINRGQNRRFRLAAVRHDEKGASPEDLRDAVVITSVFPPQWTQFRPNDDTNVHDILNDPSYNNYLDLDLDITTLVQGLQDIEGRSVHKSPVAVISIESLEDKDVLEHLGCQLQRKILQIEMNYAKISSESIARLEKFGAINSETRKVIEEINELAKGIVEEEKVQLKSNHSQLIKNLGRSPFLLRAFISTYSYHREMRVLSNPILREADKHPKALSKAQNLKEEIIKVYVEKGLRQQPGNVGPLNNLSRREMLNQIANGMLKRQQRVLDRGDLIFYLEDIGLNLILNNPSREDSEQHKKGEQYKGYVAIVSVVLFFILYGIYLLLLSVLNQIDQFNTIPFPPRILGIVAVLLLIFARSFGWHSCGLSNNGDDRTRLRYPMTWFEDAGTSAGIFMGVIVGLLFFGISEVLYSNINRDPLRFEAVVVGIFSFCLFFMLGGLEVGRRFSIVAHPEDGKRFLLVSTFMASAFWLLFFLVFFFWPRTRFDLLTPLQIVELLPTAIAYSLVTGIFIGIISALVFAHLYLRHLVLFSYLRIDANLHVTYRQFLEHSVEAGFLRRVGGGYMFRHRLIMDYFGNAEVD